uniref:Uncharacterized protein n=1 Tax=Ditylenchus dipsaci TaxID=166011 RepID=A0A915CU65_9BILA
MGTSPCSRLSAKELFLELDSQLTPVSPSFCSMNKKECFAFSRVCVWLACLPSLCNEWWWSTGWLKNGQRRRQNRLPTFAFEGTGVLAAYLMIIGEGMKMLLLSEGSSSLVRLFMANLFKMHCSVALLCCSPLGH